MPNAFTRPDGSTQPVGGYKFKAPHQDVPRYDGSTAPGDLPKKVDLRSHMTDVEDQKQTNSCAANATAGAYEYLVKRHSDAPYDVSRLFIYYNGREEDGEGDDVKDEGMTIHSAIKGLSQYGACSETTWPFDESAVNDKPSGESFTEAEGFKVEDVAVVPTDLTKWKQVLAEGYPIIFGLALFGSFDKQKQPGYVSAPSPGETGRESHGGHAMLAVGYSDPDEMFIVRNSWGAGWGDAGYCYIPYDYLMNEDLNFGDSWFIRQTDAVPHDSDTWSNDDESVIEELDTLISEMSDEDYQAMTDAMGHIHFETRLAMLFLAAASIDGDVPEDEFKDIAAYLTTVLEAMGSSYSAMHVVKHAIKHLDDKAIQRSIKLFGEHLPKSALASIATHLQKVIDEGDPSEDEQAFVTGIIDAWQVEIEASDSEDEDDDEGEDDDEDAEEEEK